MADTEKDVNRAAAAPQEEASAAQAAPEAPQPEAGCRRPRDWCHR